MTTHAKRRAHNAHVFSPERHSRIIDRDLFTESVRQTVAEKELNRGTLWVRFKDQGDLRSLTFGDPFVREAGSDPSPEQ